MSSFLKLLVRLDHSLVGKKFSPIFFDIIDPFDRIPLTLLISCFYNIVYPLV